MLTEDYLQERAKRASKEKFEAALKKVPNVEPDEYDNLWSKLPSRGEPMHSTIRTKKDISDILCENQFRLISLGVKRIGLFGSFVRGEQRHDSDVDFNLSKAEKP